MIGLKGHKQAMDRSKESEEEQLVILKQELEAMNGAVLEENARFETAMASKQTLIDSKQTQIAEIMDAVLRRNKDRENVVGLSIHHENEQEKVREDQALDGMMWRAHWVTYI